MERTKELIAYHGTDEKNIPSIMKNGFKCKSNPKHWLGNGIYFYLDYDRAKWWSSSPTSLFGTGEENKNPAVIKVRICVDPEKIMDTRIRQDYNDLNEMFKEFFQEATEGGIVKDHIDNNQLRCSFFDWVHLNYGIDVFIAGFNKTKKRDLSDKFKIPYIEYQMCVFDNNLITYKELVKDD